MVITNCKLQELLTRPTFSVNVVDVKIHKALINI